ncbi:MULTISPECIES: DUF2157 domain-containing protein [Psychrobacter]|uniref:DUF2157 domain-containing protein n=1 Tax=Psychrobacter TaxID=497 RepID=UPI000EBA8558|nr:MULTISPECIES: DUF2157 domain-containing protein [Psychrobacter]HCT74895.1 hypothetical protein [Psychrobacter sp.]
MSQPRRTIEHLLKQGILPLEHANDAALHLQVYPSKRSWLVFFDKTLLIIGAIALVLSLVFFIAYNWLHMGKIGKFALVEGALVITIALYVALSFRRRFQLIRQLLLLIASVITGSLLALFGQVYQTGADTWQLFFGWAVLIIPWVIIARFPALWLLWLGLINACLTLYLPLTNIQFSDDSLQSVFCVAALALVNLVALYFWLMSFDGKRPATSKLSGHITDKQLSSATVIGRSTTNPNIKSTTNPSLHWSTYVVGLLSTIFMTYLAIVTVFDSGNIWAILISVTVWLGWCGFIYWQFRQRRIDLLMLTYLSFSIIVVVMFWLGKWLLDGFDAGGFLILSLVLIGLSSTAVIWLRHVSRLDNKHQTGTINKGADHG